MSRFYGECKLCDKKIEVRYNEPWENPACSWFWIKVYFHALIQHPKNVLWKKDFLKVTGETLLRILFLVPELLGVIAWYIFYPLWRLLSRFYW